MYIYVYILCALDENREAQRWPCRPLFSRKFGMLSLATTTLIALFSTTNTAEARSYYSPDRHWIGHYGLQLTTTQSVAVAGYGANVEVGFRAQVGLSRLFLSYTAHAGYVNSTLYTEGHKIPGQHAAAGAGVGAWWALGDSERWMLGMTMEGTGSPGNKQSYVEVGAHLGVSWLPGQYMVDLMVGPTQVSAHSWIEDEYYMELDYGPAAQFTVGRTF